LRIHQNVAMATARQRPRSRSSRGLRSVCRALRARFARNESGAFVTEDRDQPLAAEPERDLSWYATMLDQAAASESRYTMATALREQLGCAPFGDLPEDATDETIAAVWAVDYHIEISNEVGRRVNLVPRHTFSGAPYPPALADISDTTKQKWRDLLGLVTSPVARARQRIFYSNAGVHSGIQTPSPPSTHTWSPPPIGDEGWILWTISVSLYGWHARWAIKLARCNH
jgi:hypothetical protein